MRPGQRKLGGGVVVERGGRPTCGRMALPILWGTHGCGSKNEERGGVVVGLTGFGVVQQHVVRILSVVVIRQVAGDTRVALQVKHVVRVALRAIQLDVRPREGKNGKLRMIETHSNPAIQGVALLAIGREAYRSVVGVGGLLKISAMAREAVRG